MDLRTALDVFVALAAIGGAVAVRRFARLRCADRATIAGLQRALTNPFTGLPAVTVGTAVLSASPEAGVGGDIVDVFALDGRFALLLVADVSGKGIAAAEHTAFIRYTIRALALESDGDPAIVLAKFNAMYQRTVTDTEAFVVLILGIIDAQTGAVRYAGAGHEPAFVRRADGALTLLGPTGPIVGASPYGAYASAEVRLASGDLLVWTTDGLTESRDRRGTLLGVDGLADWIAQAPLDPSGVADALVESLQRRSGTVADDVAILAVGWEAGVLEAGLPGPVPHGA